MAKDDYDDDESRDDEGGYGATFDDPDESEDLDDLDDFGDDEDEDEDEDE